MPESHSCSYDLSNRMVQLFYQDALEFLDKKLTVARIYEFVTKKELNKEEAVKLLKFIIEYSKEIDDRIHSISAFELLLLNTDQAYRILENCAVSDVNSKVRNIALNTLIKLFPEKKKKILKLKNYQLNKKT